jgi:glycosyltransferase involved in cell wall biosynthesis
MVRLFFSLIFILISIFSEAKEKVCLNMIVKNESRVITRCLDSVIPVIDYWVIVDTGSTDGTQEIIKKNLKNIPGKLYERPWKNFGDNRTEAFELAKGKGDYILFMDADDILEFENNPEFPELTYDLYHMWRGSKGFSYIKPQLVKANLPWKWVGVTHEYLDCERPYTSSTLLNVKYVSCAGGASSYDPEKFAKNVRLLTDGLKKEPNNSRYVFYLAESYRDAGEKGKALECFQKRIDMGGWEEEVFWSKLQIGHMLRALGMAPNIVIESYKLAHLYRPYRPEPIYYLCDVYLSTARYDEAYDCLKTRKSRTRTSQKDILFNEDWIEDYGFLFQLSICAFYTGHHEEALDCCDRLLAIKDLPEEWRKQTERNRNFPLAKLYSENDKNQSREYETTDLKKCLTQ